VGIMKKLDLEKFRAMKPCVEGYKFVLGLGTTDLQEIFKALLEHGPDWANWLLVRLMTPSQCVEYAILSAEGCLHIFEEKFPEDDRPRRAIQAAKEGQPEAAEAAWAAAEAAADAAAWATAWVEAAAEAAAEAAEAAWAWAAAEAAAWAAAWVEAAAEAEAEAAEAEAEAAEAARAWAAAEAAAWAAAWATAWVEAAEAAAALRSIVLEGIKILMKEWE
jgi:hypothetical protein